MTTIRQHLVWRKYLAPWTNDAESTEGKIFMKMRGKENIVRPSILDVAVERYFYDMSQISNADKIIAKNFFKKWLSQTVNFEIDVNINSSSEFLEKDFFENNYICKIENKGGPFLAKLVRGEFPFDEESYPQKVIKLLRINLLCTLMGEPLFSQQEATKLLFKAQEKLSEQDNQFEFYEFISAQMLRTWQGKRAVEDAIKYAKKEVANSVFQETTEALFPLMIAINSFIFAQTFTNQGYFIELLNNKTSIPFITGDAPVINLCVDYELKALEEVKEFKLYYPVSPSIAIICSRNITHNITRDIINEEEVHKYNAKIASAAIKQIYANSKDILEHYKLD